MPRPNNQYDEKSIQTLDALEHIRLRTGMYIGRLGNGSHPLDGIYAMLKEVVDNGVDEFDTAYAYWPYSSVGCSSNWQQMAIHILCACVNASLTKSILTRLVKCHSDYCARYTNMLYFIQLTPWANMRQPKRQCEQRISQIFVAQPIHECCAWPNTG